MPSVAYEIVVGGVNNQGAFAQNVFHYDVDEVGGDPWVTAGSLLDAWETNVMPDYRRCLSQDWTVNLMFAKKLGGSGGPTVFKPFSAPGLVGFDSMTTAFASDIAFYPGGARNRPGHCYLPAVPINALTAGVWQAGYISLIADFCSSLFIGLPAASGFTSASYGTYTRATKSVTPADHFLLKPKPTGFNRRTLPIT